MVPNGVIGDAAIAYRETQLATWLPDKKHTRARGLAIIVSGLLLNGDWRRANTVSHLCYGCCADRAQCVRKIVRHVTRPGNSPETEVIQSLELVRVEQANAICGPPQRDSWALTTSLQEVVPYTAGADVNRSHRDREHAVESYFFVLCLRFVTFSLSDCCERQHFWDMGNFRVCTL